MQASVILIIWDVNHRPRAALVMIFLKIYTSIDPMIKKKGCEEGEGVEVSKT